MRKIFSLILIVAFLLSFSAISEARVGDSRVGQIRLKSSGVINNTHTHVTTSAVFIYKVQFRAAVATAWGVIYDSSTTGSSSTIGAYLATINKEGTGRVLVDIGETTAGDWVEIDFGQTPIYAANGILAGTGDTSSTRTDAASFTAGGVSSAGDLIIHYSSN